MGKGGHIYILASKGNGTLYIGMTNHLARRIWEHRQATASAFTRKYGVTQLVYTEPFNNIESAIRREKAMKKMVPQVEARTDRERQSRLAGFLR